ncbi:MAG TPA: CDP-alcohol phosphatidyltransferase family protein [Dehalococcoidales bacterium]|nr:MAG: CDP-alcohol phosphatidyltransferase [Chloroflexi bacterium RBG_16_60_22]HJX12121.1 CDP-alcohol phosphatidyltransferase family protein [Dehalococcoidales bacterium]
MSKLDSARRIVSGHITPPIVSLLAKTPLTPNSITWIGFLLTVGAAALVVTGHLVTAGIVVLAAGLFDMLDGALARATGRVTRFGGILDSTLDRLSEAVLLLGMLYVFAREGQAAAALLAGVTMLGSFLVSYIRARVEVLGIDGKVGLFTRPERVIILALGLLLSHFGNALVIALAVIAFFSYYTVGQRLFHAWRQTRD